MKKKLLFEWRNDWLQLFGAYKWYTFTVLYLYFEYDKTRNGVECTIVILGLGFRLAYSWDFSGSEIGKLLQELENE